MVKPCELLRGKSQEEDMKRALVTGSEGDVGRVLLPQLAKHFDATGFDLRPHEGPMKVAQGNLLAYDAVSAAMEGMDAVAHIAAALPGRASDAHGAFVDANVKATTHLLQAAVEKGVRRFVYCSTVWASGHGFTEQYQPIDEAVPCAPVCMYGVTKWLGELMTEYYGRMHGLETVVLRFCGYNAVAGYDENGEINWETADIPALFLRYLGAGFKLMNPVDLGEAFRLSIENPAAAGERFVIGCHTPYTSTDVAGLRSMPAAIVDKYYPGATDLLRELGIAIPPVQYLFDHEKARTRLGFRSQHDLGDLVRMYREWKTG